MNIPNRDELIQFFSAVLPAPEAGQVFVAATPYQKNSPDDKPPMEHTHVETHEALADRVLAISSADKESYYALGRYTPHQTEHGKPGRQGKFACAVKAFWFDIDCGEDKAEGGKGYATQVAASQALKRFLSDCNLPNPSHVVASGGGLHVYWVLDREPAHVKIVVASFMQPMAE
jgi:hypothetical protein